MDPCFELTVKERFRKESKNVCYRARYTTESFFKQLYTNAIIPSQYYSDLCFLPNAALVTSDDLKGVVASTSLRIHTQFTYLCAVHMVVERHTCCTILDNRWGLQSAGKPFTIYLPHFWTFLSQFHLIISQA